MVIRPDVMAAILGMAVASYLCRAGGYALLRATRPPPFVAAMLRHLPGCIFVAFLAPVLAQAGVAAWLAAAATIMTQIAAGRLALSIAVGVLALWALGGG